MDVIIEDISTLQTPCYNPLGFYPLLLWFISFIWPVQLYQFIICIGLGAAQDYYPNNTYFELVKERIMTINAWCLPAFLGENEAHTVISIEIGIFYLGMLVFIRRLLLRWTLSYTRWIYYPENAPDNPIKGKIWRFLLWLESGSAKTTFDMEKVLPSLPLPSIDLTIQRLMGSLAPYLGHQSARYQALENGLKKWAKSEGRGCQRRLWVKTWISGNYATLWWQSYNFLCHRRQTFLDTSLVAYQEHDNYQQYTKNPLARASVFLYIFGNLRSLVKAGRINPDMFRDKVPLCMAQWRHIFATNRTPSENEDELWTYPTTDSRHFIVVHNNHFYSVPLFTKWRRIVSPDLLQKMLQYVVDDSKKKSANEREKPFSPAILTTLGRDEWQGCRSDFFSYGINNASIKKVERAICFVYLASDSQMAPYQATGKLWFDKSVNFCVFPNSRISIHADWTCMDPWIFAGLLERLRVAETPDMYDHSTGDAVFLPDADHVCSDPEPVKWQVYNEMIPVYKMALKICESEIKSLRLFEIHFSMFGRSKVKKEWHLCVDAFIQAILHVAYFRLTGRLALCAEYVPCRLYSNGRSETLRSLTSEMEDFVNAFQASSSEAGIKQAKSSKYLSLLKKACQRHEFLLKHATSGRGVDRHLLSLIIANSFRTYTRCEALDNVMQMPFDLVTCRLPNSSAKHAWQIMLPLMDQDGAIHVTYASRRDLEAFHFTISGHGNRVEKFSDLVEQTLFDIQGLFL
nr:carnitine O palmitoyltransferase 1 liver [Hymenolepis microstoma]